MLDIVIVSSAYSQSFATIYLLITVSKNCI